MRQDNRDERCYRIEELAELGGVTRRTVRYYVQRGLLPTPLGTGRGPHYTQAHLQRLIHIRQLQEAGVPLAEVAARLDGVPQTPAGVPELLPERSTWMRFVLVDGVELHVRAGAATSSRRNWRVWSRPTRQTLGFQTVLAPLWKE